MLLLLVVLVITRFVCSDVMTTKRIRLPFASAPVFVCNSSLLKAATCLWRDFRSGKDLGRFSARSHRSSVEPMVEGRKVGVG